MESINVNELQKEVERELASAQAKYPRFHSLHEAYAVLLEEVDELWEITRKKQSNQLGFQGREECIQIAAMAFRTIIDRELT